MEEETLSRDVIEVQRRWEICRKAPLPVYYFFFCGLG